jgi:thiol peroxidase
MATITFKGQPIHTIGKLPEKGEQAPDFQLTKNDLKEINRQDFTDRILVLSIFPSIDTPVCAKATRQFNEYANQLKNVTIIGVSQDTPFALNRFCAAEGLEHVITTSSFRHPEFAKDYGVLIIDSPLKGFLSRAVIVIDQANRVCYSEQVPEITNEPNYDKVINAITSK